MKAKFCFQTVFLILIPCASVARSQHHEATAHSPSQPMADCSMHEKHMAELKERGGRAMGFDQDKTTHRFRLMRDGGAIEAEANDVNDVASRDQIRRHLELITKLFAEGDFSKPFAVHAQIPPGVDVLNRLKAAISYSFEETEKGGRVRITTADSAALKAVHDFLRFQITDHQTGDPLSPI